MIVLGINPGPRSTGLAIVAFDPAGPRLVWDFIVHRAGPAQDPALPVPLRYLDRIYAVAAEIRVDVIGVEDITPPARSTFNRPATVSTSDTAPILASSIVSGYCLTFGQLAHIVAVPEHDSHGAGPLGSYPESMVAADERRNPLWRTRTGTGHAPLRHARAAYDVARMAHRMTTQKAKVAG